MGSAWAGSNSAAPRPDGVFLGHAGDGMGHQTQTFYSFDGGRQITVSWNIDDKQAYTNPEAFDEALFALLTAGLCSSDS